MRRDDVMENARERLKGVVHTFSLDSIAVKVSASSWQFIDPAASNKAPNCGGSGSSASCRLRVNAPTTLRSVKNISSPWTKNTQMYASMEVSKGVVTQLYAHATNKWKQSTRLKLAIQGEQVK